WEAPELGQSPPLGQRMTCFPTASRPKTRGALQLAGIRLALRVGPDNRSAITIWRAVQEREDDRAALRGSPYRASNRALQTAMETGALIRTCPHLLPRPGITDRGGER